MRSSSALKWLGGAGAAWVLLSSCSVLYDLSPDQCGSTSECTSRFGSGFRCEEGLCKSTGQAGRGGSSSAGEGGEPPDPNGGTGETGGTGGTTEPGGGVGNQGGEDVTAGTGGTVVKPECEVHTDCKQPDPHACVEGKCVRLRSDECPRLLPIEGDAWLNNLKDPDAVILGGFLQMNPDSFTSNQVFYADLALSDVTAFRGIPIQNSTNRRPVVMVVCNGDSPDEDELGRSAEHLINELKVPGIVSMLQSSDVQRVFEDYGSAAGTFIVSGADADDSLVNMPDEGLVWTMLASGSEVVEPMAPLLTRIIDYLKGPAAAVPADEDVRVALVYPDGEPRLLNTMGTAIQDSIEFNGLSALDNGENYKYFDITTIYDDETADLSPLVDGLVEFKPHVIIGFGTNEFLNKVLPQVESRWDAEVTPAQTRPFYVLSPYLVNRANLIATQLAINAKALRRRIVGLAFAAAEDPGVYNRYVNRFKAVYPEAQNYLYQENQYDAPYYLLYALTAAGNPPRLTGKSIASGMLRIIDGRERFDVGVQKDYGNASAILTSNATSKISLIGTLGDPSFDVSTGARKDGGSIFCVDSTNAFVPDIIRYKDDMLVDQEPSISTKCIPDF